MASRTLEAAEAAAKSRRFDPRLTSNLPLARWRPSPGVQGSHRRLPNAIVGRILSVGRVEIAPRTWRSMRCETGLDPGVKAQLLYVLPRKPGENVQQMSTVTGSRDGTHGPACRDAVVDQRCTAVQQLARRFKAGACPTLPPGARGTGHQGVENVQSPTGRVSNATAGARGTRPPAH